MEEFNNIKHMLNYGNLADDLFKRWYIDGRLYFHIVVNDKSTDDSESILKEFSKQHNNISYYILGPRPPEAGGMPGA